MRRIILATGVLLATAAQGAIADERWSLCPAPLPPAFAPGPDAALDRAIAPLRLDADLLDGDLEQGGQFSGNVVLQQADRTLRADRVIYEATGETVRAEGRIRYSDRDLDIESALATIELDPDRVRFDALSYRLHRSRGRGGAESLVGIGERVTLTDVDYTTCPGGDDGWLLNARSIELDTEAGVGVARDVRVEIQGVPIFYTPWLSFPLNDDRKTGFLMPAFGRARNTGFDFSIPWYWNIAPNMDATITPRWMQHRGLQLTSEFRYLTERNAGTVDLEVLPDDDVTGDTRSLFGWQHLTEFAPGWRFAVDFNYASDPDYFEDLAGSLDLTVITHLRREAVVSYEGNRNRFVGRVDGWQTLDRAIADADRPYARLPQLLWQLRYPTAPRGPVLTLDTELVAFDTSTTRITGSRFDFQPGIRWPLSGAGWHFVPAASWRHTRYELDNDTSETRSLPSFSLDAGLVFERDAGNDRVQTLEPRLYWLRVPYRDQTALPLFDTSTPDFNMVQLFHDNRFNGSDRVGDANQVSVGVVSRIYSSRTGRELLQLQAGRIRYFDDRRVTLPGDPVDTRVWSDVLFEAQAALSDRWSARAGIQYDPDSGKFERSAVQLRWHPSEDRIVNVGWRFRRGQIDQSDLSFSWPLSERWRAIGRWNYSLEDSRTLETFAGFEYQSCCWAVRFVSRQYIANRAGDRNRSLYLQLELKGLASVGRGIDDLLSRGILRHP